MVVMGLRFWGWIRVFGGMGMGWGGIWWVWVRNVFGDGFDLRWGMWGRRGEWEEVD